MSSSPPTGDPPPADATVRADLEVVELDGDLVVYDPVSTASHVLSGGAVVVWHELARSRVGGLVERVADLVGEPVDDIADDVGLVVAQLTELGLLEIAR